MVSTPPPAGLPPWALTIDRPHVIDTGAACSQCLKMDVELMRCSACLHAWYCSQECQRIHYKDHKRSCKLLKKFSALHEDLPNDIRPKNAQEFYMQRLNARTLLERLVNRHLTRGEARAIMNEAKCSVCMRTRDQLQGSSLICCPACHWGWTCPDHMMQYLTGPHQGMVCKQYSLMNKCEMWVHKIITTAGKLPSYRPDTLFTAYRPLPLEGGWEAYKSWRPLPNLDPTMMTVFTKKLSQPLTVLAALQRHYTQQELEALDTLTIHVLGASGYEVPADGVWEELLHVLPYVKALHVDFIGPEVKNIILDEEDGLLIHKPVCDGCVAKHCSRTYSYHMCTYHEFIKRCEDKGAVQSPALAVGFNCGMHDKDEKAHWTPSIKILMERGTPVVFTSYNVVEGAGDAAAWRQLGGHVTHTAEENPYHSLEPLPEAMLFEHALTRFDARSGQ